jgi:hypothetical protein
MRRLPSSLSRKYFPALAPRTKEASASYDKAPTPVLVIRQRSEAWTRPFAAIYEPTAGVGAIKSVTALTQHSEFAGFKVVSQVGGEMRIYQILVLPAADTVFEDATRGLSSRGRYAVVTLNGCSDECVSL